MFVVPTESGMCMRQCCGNERGFVMHIVNNFSQVAYVIRPVDRWDLNGCGLSPSQAAGVENNLTHPMYLHLCIYKAPVIDLKFVFAAYENAPQCNISVEKKIIQNFGGADIPCPLSSPLNAFDILPPTLMKSWLLSTHARSTTVRYSFDERSPVVPLRIREGTTFFLDVFSLVFLPSRTIFLGHFPPPFYKT